MSTRDDAIPQDFVRLLHKLRPALKQEPVEVQQSLAYMVWVSPTKSREHALLETYVSFAYQELNERFGRSKFHAINERLQLFDVTKNWYSRMSRALDGGLLPLATRGFKVKPDIEAQVFEYQKGWRRRMARRNRRLIGLDGKHINAIPVAVASKDTRGITAKAWERAKVKNRVPVDMVRLTRYAKMLERMLDDKQADLFIQGAEEDYRYRIDTLGRLAGMAVKDDEGQWSILQRYVESESGRLYGKNINLQTVPRSIKQAALHGMWEYDFSNCHYTILHQLAAQYGVECNAIGDYLERKREVRHQLMRDLGIGEQQAKDCLIALIYGARFSHRAKDAIPRFIGKEKAERLYQHPLYVALRDDVAKARRELLLWWPRSRKRLQNAHGKWILESKSPAQILAHLLQGIEAQMLEAVRKMDTAGHILLLQHDGFASRQRLDIPAMREAIKVATGFDMPIEEQRISLSPDLGLGTA